MFQHLLRHPYFLLAAIFFVYFFFGLNHITQFITADEHYWVYERIPQYWESIADGKWKKTLINDKPGVSLALVTGAALIPDYSPRELCLENQDHITLCDNEQVAMALLFFRILLLLCNFLVLLYLFFVLKKITSVSVTLLAILFMALSPILLGITQIVNPDALLWSFGAAAIFSFYALLKLRVRPYIFLSGFFLCLAILSKYTASFLLPFFLFLSVLAPFFGEAHESAELFATRLKENLLYFFGTFLFAFLLGTLLLPASWMNPSTLLKLFWGGDEVFFPLSLFILPGIFVFDILFFRSRLTFAVQQFFTRIHFLGTLQKIFPLILLLTFLSLILGRIFFPEWTLFEKVPFDTKDLYAEDKPDKFFKPNFLQSWFLEFNPLVFSLTPVILMGFFSWCIRQIFIRKHGDQESDFLSFSLSFFVIAFIIVLILSETLATSRYLILLYPVIALLAAFGIETIRIKILALFRDRSVLPWMTVGFPTMIGAGVVMSMLFISPFYFNYTNFLLPKNKIIHHAWGYGGYEAAQFLNNLPDAEKLTIWSDYDGVCEFFVGRCMTLEYQAARETTFDYVVLSARGKTLYNPTHTRWKKPDNHYMEPYYNEPNPPFHLIIDKRPNNFIKVVKVEKK